MNSYIDGLVQVCGISSVNTLEVPQSSIKPSISSLIYIFSSTVPPVINKQASRLVTVTEGDVAALACDSQGFPPPTISWIYDGRTNIDNGVKYGINEETGMLTIQDVHVSIGLILWKLFSYDN